MDPAKNAKKRRTVRGASGEVQGDAVISSKHVWGIMAASIVQVPLTARSADTPPAAPAARAPAPVKYFPILEYRIEGNTVMKSVEVERAVMPYLGIGKTIKDVEAARLNLEKAYHALGFQTVLVNIPQQEVSTGVVRLTVVEAPVGKLTIKGSKYHSLQVIRATVPSLEPGSTPNFNDVQKQLGQLNHTQDLHVVPVLRASTTPGKVDVDLDVTDELPAHAMVEANNRYSANTAHVRLVGELSYDNLFQSNQSVSVQYQTAPDDPANAKIWSISYVIPFASGPAVALYAISSDSNIAAVGALNVVGNGNIFGIRLIEPLFSPSPSFYHSFSVGFDFKDFKQDTQLQGADDLASPARYEPFSVDYTATWLGSFDATKHAAAAISGNRSSTNLDIGASFVIRFLGGTDATQFAIKRYGADPNYVTLHPSLERQQLLPWNFSLMAKVDAQIASGPLISNEQYGIGGVDSVRGYVESERLGDNGIHETLELRSPQLLGRLSPRITQSYVYLFGDAGHVRILDPLPAQFTGYHIASYGAGLRFRFFGLAADVDGAHALDSGYVTRKGENSVQFLVNYAW